MRRFEKVLSKNACGTMWHLFLKNTGTAGGKQDKPFRDSSLRVPETLGTSMGQVGTNLGQSTLNPVSATVDFLSECVGPWDSGTSRDAGDPTISLERG